MADEYRLSEQEMVLGMVLAKKKLSKKACVQIIMTLNGDDQVADMIWYIDEHPDAGEEELIAVAYQIAKDGEEDDGQN